MSPGVSNLDGAIFVYFLATGVTPAMAEKMVGESGIETETFPQPLCVPKT
jgi:hypothetical protein